MLSTARGYLCLSMTEADCDRLELHPQSAVNTTVRGTALRSRWMGTPSTGSAPASRPASGPRCIQMLIDPGTRPDDLRTPRSHQPAPFPERGGRSSAPGRPRGRSTCAVSPASLTLPVSRRRRSSRSCGMTGRWRAPAGPGEVLRRAPAQDVLGAPDHRAPAGAGVAGAPPGAGARRPPAHARGGVHADRL